MNKATIRTLLIIMPAITMLLASSIKADIKIKMDTTTIKGNTELPKILYIVPWREIKHLKQNEQQFIIHSLYSDLFTPILTK